MILRRHVWLTVILGVVVMANTVMIIRWGVWLMIPQVIVQRQQVVNVLIAVTQQILLIVVQMYGADVTIHGVVLKTIT